MDKIHTERYSHYLLNFLKEAPAQENRENIKKLGPENTRMWIPQHCT
jgi:hypothetical protein